MKVIETDRLILRTWKNEDIERYYYINQDPTVIEFLSGSLTKKEAFEFTEFMNQQFDQIGYTLFAAESKLSGNLIGSIGLDPIKWEAPFGPSVEIAWRLGSEYWGKGYATEGAKAILEYGFNKCALKEIIALALPANYRSIRVMEKIDMVYAGDFHHTKLPHDHPRSLRVLYRKNNPKPKRHSN